MFTTPQHRLSSLFLFTLLAAIFKAAAAAENEFIFPPPYDPANDFYEDNPVYTAGKRITVTWRTTFDAFKLFSMQGSDVVSYSPDIKLESNATFAPHATSYSWEVWTNIEDPPYIPLFLIIYNSKNESEFFRTRSFNITNGPAPDGIAYTATEPDPSVKTSSAVVVGGPSASTVTAVSTVVETVAAHTVTATPESESSADSGGESDKLRAMKLGLGIGLGVGLGGPLLAVAVLFFCGVLSCRAAPVYYNPREGDGNNGETRSVSGSRPVTPMGGIQNQKI